MSVDDNYAPNANGKCPHCGQHACFKKPECFKIDDNGKIITKETILTGIYFPPSSNFGVDGRGETIWCILRCALIEHVKSRS